jgi:predicted RecB family nuclease
MAPSNTNLPVIRLSKSRYIAGRQCSLRLWLRHHRPEVGARPTPAQEARFDAGDLVGELATRRHPGGVLVDDRWPEPALATTVRLLEDASIPALFEAAFRHRGMFVRVDILERLQNERWRVIEVKASTRLKEVHLEDVAAQTWALRGAGIDVVEVGLLLLNREYVFGGGEHDLAALFRYHDVTTETERALGSIAGEVRRMQAMLAGPAPAIEPGRQCDTPYACEFSEPCVANANLPAHSIRELPRLSAKNEAELRSSGVEAIADIPEDWRLTPTQQRVRNALVGGVEHVSDGLGDALDSLEYPVCYFDVEAVATAIPRYAGARPYQALPFQWSIHRDTGTGEPEHFEFLHDRDSDPREAFARSLLEVVGDRGSIAVYSSYEKRILGELAAALPALAPRIEPLVERLADVLAIVRGHIYHPAFHGSFSLKRVLPVLVPALGYGDLAIQDGEIAALEYLTMLELPRGRERGAVRRNLLAYCGRDTLGLSRLCDALRERTVTTAA